MSTGEDGCVVLEFYCGIGGLRYAYEMATADGALPASHPLSRPAKIVSFDISLCCCFVPALPLLGYGCVG